MHTSENVDLKMHTSENTRSQNANIYFLISEPVYLDLILIGNRRRSTTPTKACTPR